ncbi:MAG: hypothetical protein ACR2PM_04620 [Hyphomicrobiales bacterium]
MNAAHCKRIARACAAAIAVGATVMSVQTANAEAARELTVEGRAAKTDRLDLSKAKKNTGPARKSDRLTATAPSRQKAKPAQAKKTARVSSDQGDEKGSAAAKPANRTAKGVDDVPEVIFAEPATETDGTARNFADGRIAKPSWKFPKESLDRFGRRFNYVWQLGTDTK